MRTGTVVFAVVIGVGAGLGRLAHLNGLLAPQNPRGVPATVAAAAAPGAASGPTAASGTHDSDPLPCRSGIHGPIALADDARDAVPAAPVEPHAARLFMLECTQDGTWRIVHMIPQDAHAAASPGTAGADG